MVAVVVTTAAATAVTIRTKKKQHRIDMFENFQANEKSLLDLRIYFFFYSAHAFYAPYMDLNLETTKVTCRTFSNIRTLQGFTRLRYEQTKIYR